MTKLWITIEDIAKLSGFDGNIDNDTINPFIFMAQTSEIKRILGDDLYNKINTDFVADTLAGDYLKVKNEWADIILAYFTCSFYLQLGIPKVSQNGAYLVTPEKTEQIWDDKTNRMAEKYEKIAIGLENSLIEYLNGANLPEFTTEKLIILSDEIVYLPNGTYKVTLEPLPTLVVGSKFSYTVADNVTNKIIYMGKAIFLSETESVQDYTKVSNTKYYQ